MKKNKKYSWGWIVTTSVIEQFLQNLPILKKQEIMLTSVELKLLI